jgi:uncharacterized repeat protein (TIGR03803 family)
LYSFAGEPNGQYPVASLIDVNGTLYGTTSYGGMHDDGTVFSISTSGTEHVLYSFAGEPDGQYPKASLINVSGTLYGTAYRGGRASDGFGTVFGISMSGTGHVIHSFRSRTGNRPLAGLIDVKGALYGTTRLGGIYHIGTVFSLRLTK